MYTKRGNLISGGLNRLKTSFLLIMVSDSNDPGNGNKTIHYLESFSLRGPTKLESDQSGSIELRTPSDKGKLKGRNKSYV